MSEVREDATGSSLSPWAQEYLDDIEQPLSQQEMDEAAQTADDRREQWAWHRLQLNAYFAAHPHAHAAHLPASADADGSTSRYHGPTTTRWTRCEHELYQCIHQTTLEALA